MRLVRLLAVCALVATLASSVTGAADARSPGQSTAAMVARINAVRAQHGLAPLRLSPSLTRSSRRFSRKLMRYDRFGHDSRIHASPAFRLLGEALAFHSGRRDAVGGTVRQWLHSPPHRAIVLTRSMRYLGAGVTHGRFGRAQATIWVLQVGRK